MVERVHLSRMQRGALVVVGGILLCLLAAAALLQPDPRGFGTHQQFGLEPCTIRASWGIPCPACGMTTSWSHLLHGQFLAAVSANSGGVLLAIAATVIAPWVLVSGLLGRWWFPPPSEPAAILASLVVFTVITADWVRRIMSSS
jgi:hypothetical protein